MKFKYCVLNIFLCLVILLLAGENYEVWNGPVGPSRISGTAAGATSETSGKIPQAEAAPNAMADFQANASIAANNIFSPERKEFPALAASGEAQRPVARPQIFLKGVAIAGEYQFATVVNPGRPLRNGERETQTLKIGEKIGGYTLARIMPDRIAMENNGDTFEVLLNDPRARRQKMEAGNGPPPIMVASSQPVPESPPAEMLKPPPVRDMAPATQRRVQAPETPSLPFNRYTYQMFSSSATVRGGRIYAPPTGTPAMESAAR